MMTFTKKLQIGSGFLFATMLFLVPTVSYGVTTHTYTCAELSNTNASCTGGTWTFTGASEYAYTLVDGPSLNNATWYVSAVYSGSGTAKIDCTGSCTSSNGTFTSTIVDRAVVFSGSGSSYMDLTNNGGSFVGTISALCVSDTPGVCVSVPPTPPNPAYEIFGTTTATYSIIDNPNQDMFNLVLVFTMWFFGGYWLFAKRR